MSEWPWNPNALCILASSYSFFMKSAIRTEATKNNNASRKEKIQSQKKQKQIKLRTKSGNPGLNFNSDCFKAFSRVIFPVLFKASNHQIIDLETVKLNLLYLCNISRSDTYNEMKLSPNANRSLLSWSLDMSRGQKLKFH